MIDAYTIGIRLALNDELSVGLRQVRRDLAALDRASTGSAARLQGLRRIGAQAAAVATGYTARAPSAARRVDARPAGSIHPQVARRPAPTMALGGAADRKRPDASLFRAPAMDLRTRVMAHRPGANEVRMRPPWIAPPREPHSRRTEVPYRQYPVLDRGQSRASRVAQIGRADRVDDTRRPGLAAKAPSSALGRLVLPAPRIASGPPTRPRAAPASSRLEPRREPGRVGHPAAPDWTALTRRLLQAHGGIRLAATRQVAVGALVPASPVDAGRRRLTPWRDGRGADLAAGPIIRHRIAAGARGSMTPKLRTARDLAIAAVSPNRAASTRQQRISPELTRRSVAPRQASMITPARRGPTFHQEMNDQFPQSDLPSHAELILDGVQFGRLVADRLARHLDRPHAGTTFPDPRATPTWPGPSVG